MAKSYNLISCDEVLYPSIYGVTGTGFSSASGSVVMFDNNTNRSYTITENKQHFFPYVFTPSTGEQLTLTVTKIVKNGEDKLEGIFKLVYNVNEFIVNSSGSFSNPTVYPTNYTDGESNATNYIVDGTGYGITGISFIESTIQSFLPEVAVKRAQPTSPSVSGEVFANFVIELPKDDSYEFQVTVASNLAPTKVYDYLITQTAAVYKINNALTPVYSSLYADYFTTDNKGVRLQNYSFKTINTISECPCELCDNCFTLTNCETNEVMISYSDLVSFVGDVVQLEEESGCWKVEFCPESSAVTVKDSFTTCKACLPTCPPIPKC